MQPAKQQSRLNEDVIQIAIRLGLLVALVYWCFVLVQPFIAILAWSAVLAVALYPLHAWLSERLGQRAKLSACIITVIAIAIVIGPVTWLGFGLVEGLRTISEQIDPEWVPSPPATIKEWPLIGESYTTYGIRRPPILQLRLVRLCHASNRSSARCLAWRAVSVSAH